MDVNSEIRLERMVSPILLHSFSDFSLAYSKGSQLPRFKLPYGEVHVARN